MYRRFGLSQTRFGTLDYQIAVGYEINVAMGLYFIIIDTRTLSYLIKNGENINPIDNLLCIAQHERSLIHDLYIIIINKNKVNLILNRR